MWFLNSCPMAFCCLLVPALCPTSLPHSGWLPFPVLSSLSSQINSLHRNPCLGPAPGRGNGRQRPYTSHGQHPGFLTSTPCGNPGPNSSSEQAFRACGDESRTGLLVCISGIGKPPTLPPWLLLPTMEQLPLYSFRGQEEQSQRGSSKRSQGCLEPRSFYQNLYPVSLTPPSCVPSPQRDASRSQKGGS